jgi:hypothetical protein
LAAKLLEPAITECRTAHPGRQLQADLKEAVIPERPECGSHH